MNTQNKPETEILNTRSRAALDWARALQNENTDPNALNETLLAFQFNQLLEAIGFDKIKTDVEKQPKEFLEVARTMLEQSSERTKRMKVELELQLYREQVTEQKRKMEDAVNTDRSELGLSPEALQKIEEAMARL
jgi:aminopeptidase N